MKADVLDQVLGGADELVRNFVRLVVEKGRAGEIREIAEEFEALIAAQANVLDVEVTTAHELSDARLPADRRRHREEVRAQGPGDRAASTPELIGGIVLQAGSMRLDASVRGRLDRLRQELATTRS